MASVNDVSVTQQALLASLAGRLHDGSPSVGSVYRAVLVAFNVFELLEEEGYEVVRTPPQPAPRGGT